MRRALYLAEEIAMTRPATILALACLLGAVTCAHGKPPAPGATQARIERYARQVEADRQALGIAGLSVAVLDDGKVAWMQGFGYADVEHKIPATPDTLYHVASITKTFTATLVHRLVENGKLHYDDPVMKYTDEVKDPRIRVRHLLSHTADGTPGDAYAYNPDQFEHLKALLEKVDGRPLRQQFVEEILDPLGMTDSVPGPDTVTDAQWAMLGEDRLARYRKALEREAKGYTVWGDREVVFAGSPPREFWASAGLLSTVRDLAKYDLALDRHDLLHKDTLEDIWKPVLSNAGQPLPFGLGWYVTDYRGERLVFHYGHWGTSFSALYLKVPARRLGVIVLANSEALADHHYKVGEDVTNNVLACHFLDTFLPAIAPGGNPRFAAQDGKDNAPPKGTPLVGPAKDCAVNSAIAVERFVAERRAAARTTIPLDPKLAAEFAGRYQLPHRAVTVSDEGGHLFIDVPRDEGHAEMFAVSPTDFFIKNRLPWTLRFVREGGKVVRLEFLDRGEVTPAPRMQP
jgi:CubicO group peptidase (beta-lactamase class C family)